MSSIRTVGLIIALVAQGQTAEPETQMSEEVAALHRAVFEVQRGEVFVEPSLYRDLALRYLYGRGVQQDLPQGCALLYDAHAAALAPRHDQEGIDVAQALIEHHCRTLSPGQLIELKNLTGCGFIGLTPHTLPLNPGSWIEFSRMGYVIERPSGRTEEWFAGDPMCMRHVKMLRSVLLQPGGPHTTERYVIEMLAWEGASKNGAVHRELWWRLFGIGDSRLNTLVQELLVSEPGSLWPPPALPHRFRGGANLSATRSGAIGWQFPGDPPHRGTLPR